MIVRPNEPLLSIGMAVTDTRFTSSIPTTQDLVGIGVCMSICAFEESSESLLHTHGLYCNTKWSPESVTQERLCR